MKIYSDNTRKKCSAVRNNIFKLNSLPKTGNEEGERGKRERLN